MFKKERLIRGVYTSVAKVGKLLFVVLSMRLDLWEDVYLLMHGEIMKKKMYIGGRDPMTPKVTVVHRRIHTHTLVHTHAHT